MGVKTYSASRDGNTYLSKHFQVREFKCKDGSDKILINSALINVLERLYEHLNASAINITSGYRTPAHSVKVGGYATDQHTKGNAADIKVKRKNGTLYTSAEICCALEDLDHQGGVGRINKDHSVHVDVRGNKCWFDELAKMKLVDSWYKYLNVKKLITEDCVAPKKKSSVTGVDLSHWNNKNGPIKFDRLKAAGVDFVILHAGYGRFCDQKDPYFEDNYAAAKAAGLPVGAYWYSYAKTPDRANEEARTFLGAIKGKSFEYPVYYDVEEPDQFILGQDKVSAIIDTFCQTVQDAGYYVGLYMSASFLERYVTDDVKQKYTLWVAQYANKCAYKGVGTIGIWQAMSNGRINGVIGEVDVNYAYIDFPTEISEKGLNGFQRDPGDVDGDGKITSSDAQTTLQAAAKTTVLTGAAKRAADVDGDGKITAADAKEILKKAAKIK